MVFQESEYHPHDFANRRHIGAGPSEITVQNFEAVGFPSLEALIDATVPADIRYAVRPAVNYRRPERLPSAPDRA